MHSSVFGELSIIIGIGTLIALCMRLLKQPLIISHIITGIVVGPSVLDLVKSAETIETFSSIGIALLLFIIGLGMNPKVIKEVGKISAIAGVIQVGFSALLGFMSGKLFGLSNTESLFLGVAVSFSSTIIILKLLSDKKEQTRLHGKIVTGLLIIQDVLATTALVFVTAQSSDSGLNISGLAGLFIKGWALGGGLMLVGWFVLPKLHRLIAGSQEFLFLFAIGWGFGSAALFEFAGFSLEIGALIAGIALSGLPYAQEISARLRPLRDFFIVVFFISLGTRISFSNISSVLPLIFAASFVTIVMKPLIVMGIAGAMGFTKKTSFKAAITTGQVSEFSLVFVLIGQKSGIIGDTVVNIVTITALISIAVSTYMILYADSLYMLFEHKLSLFERRTIKSDKEKKEHHDLVLFGYVHGGHEYLRLFRTMKKSYVVVDYDPDVIEMLEKQKANYIYGDASDVELLEDIGLEQSKLVISTLVDHDTNVFLVKLMESINPGAVVISHADTAMQAEELYELGASYVMVPHRIGSEQISSFIRKSGLKKSAFKAQRNKHLAQLHHHLGITALGA
ncbi:cation:proton antiporter [Candidatus Saccharibacteria bacterium]|nr:cation:proton antiporter [Candidatus Saccharibacteria bacterium]